MAAVWIFQPFKISNQWYFPFPAGVAEKQIYQFQLPSQAQAVSEIEIINTDGALPEIVSLSFTVNNLRVAEVKSHFLSQCELLDLTLVTNDDHSEPDKICFSEKQGAYIGVNLSQRCSETSCKYFFSVNSI